VKCNVLIATCVEKIYQIDFLLADRNTALFYKWQVIFNFIFLLNQSNSIAMKKTAH